MVNLKILIYLEWAEEEVIHWLDVREQLSFVVFYLVGLGNLLQRSLNFDGWFVSAGRVVQLETGFIYRSHQDYWIVLTLLITDSFFFQA